MPVEQAARGQRWAKERPWKTQTHVRWEREMPTLDGHDLSAKLMKRALKLLLDEVASLDTGAVLIVTGRGRHTLGAKGVLPQIVQGVVGRAASEQGWRLRPHGPGAWVLVVDASRAPASATAAFGWGEWLLFLFLGGCALLAIAATLGWL